MTRSDQELGAGQVAVERRRRHQLLVAAPADHPHPERKRLPAYRPPLSPIARPWRGLRRRATHNRLFDTLADLRRSVRDSLSYYQTTRERVRTLLERRPRKRTPSTGS